MMTKQQEREALERIKNILADAGADSYIGMAFAGCVEDAESNIENDWALSMAGRWQNAEQKLEAVKAEADGLRAERETMRAELDRCNTRIAELTEAAQTLNSWRSEEHTMREGVLGHGDVLLYDDAGKLKTYVIREVAINEWSSGHKVRGYNIMPEKYRVLLDKQR